MLSQIQPVLRTPMAAKFTSAETVPRPKVLMAGDTLSSGLSERRPPGT